MHIYNCTFGVNRHKENTVKCKAKIGIPISTKFTEEALESIIIILNEKHCCDPKTDIIQNIISDAKLKSYVETIYISENPRPTKNQLIDRLYKILEDETPEGQEIQTFSHIKVNSYYSEFEKKYKKEDNDFQELLKTTNNSVFERFKIRYTTKSGKTGLIIGYSSDFQISLIPEVDYVFIDCTFKVAPVDFEQVMVIMGKAYKVNFPISYILLPDKEQQTYETALFLFKTVTNAKFRAGVTFITDFEKAEIKAVQNELMKEGDYLQLCYFHFTQSMNAHFQKYPKSKIRYELNSIANMLPFVSEEKVKKTIFELNEYEETRRFSKYFLRNYLSIYKIQYWNVTTKIQTQTITNNVVESHNNLLNFHIKEKPSLSEFENKIALIEEHYRRMFSEHATENIKIERITEEEFDVKYINFISKLENRKYRREKSNYSITPNKKVFRNSNNNKKQSKEKRLIIQNHDEPKETETSNSDSDDEFFTESANLSQNSIETFNNQNIIEIQDYSQDENNQEDHYYDDDEEEVQEYNQEEEEEEEHIDDNFQSQKKYRSTQQINEKNQHDVTKSFDIRHLPIEVQQILQKNIREFYDEKPRSKQRRQITEHTMIEVQRYIPMTKMQVRSWFDNNKNKNFK